jgi:hypothetical protein
MSTNESPQELVVRSLGFNIPCRQFVIGAQVTRDKRMPLVDEFVLRILRLCERTSVRRLTSFFGFTQLEMQVALTDLQARSLVIVEADQVILHPAAFEMFRTAGDGPPQIMEVEGWINRIWFDLISQTMINSPTLRNVRNLIELRKSGADSTLPSNFAREAFQTNFREYLRNIRKIANSEHLSLYAVTSVDPGRFSYAQITALQVLRYAPQPKTEITLNVPDVERPQRLRQLTDAMMEALQTYADPEPSLNARAEYNRLTESDPGLSPTSPFIDIREWLADEGRHPQEGVRAFIGTPSLDANRLAFIALLERSPEIRRLPQEQDVELVWFRPGGTLWGSSEDLRSMVQEIRAAIRRSPNPEASVRSTLVVPASTQVGVQRKRFRNLFDDGLIAPAGLLNRSVELLLVRGLGAIVSVLVPLSSSAHVWIGRMTINPDDLQRIDKRIAWQSKGAWSPIWTQRSPIAAEDGEPV